MDSPTPSPRDQFFPFYPSDWLGDTRALTTAAKGLRIDLMALMHEHGEPYGHLATASGPMDRSHLSKVLGYSKTEFDLLLQELVMFGGFKKTGEGLIYSERLLAMRKWRTNKQNAGHASAAARGYGSGGKPSVRTPVQAPVRTPVRTEPEQTLEHLSEPIGVGVGSGVGNGSGSELASGVPPNVQLDFKAASALLTRLNEKAGTRFKDNPGTLHSIALCLHITGNDVAGVVAMIDRQCALWRTDSRMNRYLRPSTLFGDKFSDYYGQRGVALTVEKTENAPLKIGEITSRLIVIERRLKEIADSALSDDVSERRDLRREQTELLEKQKKAMNQ